MVRDLTLPGLPDDKPFALLFSGGFVVEKPGRYTLSLGSDDGAVLYLDGQRVLDCDGQHAYLERTATVDLEPGVYKMAISYFDAGGARRLSFSWTTPDGVREPIRMYRR